jgi:plastocyanin
MYIFTIKALSTKMTKILAIIPLIGIAFAITAIASMSILSYKTELQTAKAAATISSSSSSNIATGNVTKIQAGVGQDSISESIFSPQRVQIRLGDSVTWYNPTPVAEPHTVSFVFDNKTMTNIITPFAIRNIKELVPLPPGSNSQPTTVPGKNIVLSLNSRVFNPAVIDSQGKVKTVPINSNYTMTGTEKFVNSGFILPKGKEQAYPGSGNSFTIRFEKAGTYNYICIIHPWMKGTVTVK